MIVTGKIEVRIDGKEIAALPPNVPLEFIEPVRIDAPVVYGEPVLIGGTVTMTPEDRAKLLETLAWLPGRRRRPLTRRSRARWRKRVNRVLRGPNRWLFSLDRSARIAARADLHARVRSGDMFAQAWARAWGCSSAPTLPLVFADGTEYSIGVDMGGPDRTAIFRARAEERRRLRRDLAALAADGSLMLPNEYELRFVPAECDVALGPAQIAISGAVEVDPNEQAELRKALDDLGMGGRS